MVYKNNQLFNVLRRYATWGCKNMSTTTKAKACEDREVVFECINKRGIITLNKPRALNALNYTMVCRILEKLHEWESVMDLVIIKGKGRAFCAGGDIVDITREGPENPTKGKLFFKHEYLMNNFIGTYRIPYISILDGITMGGGMGLSVHGKYRIATENTLCAMPETSIGLYPDVGGTYFLPRLPGSLGMYLGLTGHRLKGEDVVKAGIATHFCPSGSIAPLLDAILNKVDSKDLDTELGRLSKDVSSAMFSLEPHLLTIDRIFSLCTIEEILDALDKEGTDFSLKTLETLKKMSPTSLKITQKSLQKGQHMSLQECLQMEIRISGAILEGRISNDFYEGVRALLVDKDKKPKWCPQLKDITDQMLESVFEPLNPDEELVT